MMNLKSYDITRNKDFSYLTIHDNELYMVKDTKERLTLSTTDGIYGLIHNDSKALCFIEISKQNSRYAFRDLKNSYYFCSKPLGNNEFKRSFISNRLIAQDWELFDLVEKEINNHDLINSFINLLVNFKKNDTIKLYWWKANNFTNFGDELNLHVVSHISKKIVQRVEKIETDLVAIGSTLDWFPKREKKYPVWGTGTLTPCQLLSDNQYDVHLLRGPLTESLFDNKLNVVYGDPGLLSSTIWPEVKEKKFDWGIIVHFSQENQHWVKNILKNTPNSILISVKNNDMNNLMSTISACRNIASTSLHGLVVADSYCIPNYWLWDNNLHKGGQWKFFDYFAGIKRKNIDNIDPKTISSLSSLNQATSEFKYFDNIYDIQQRILKTFPL